MNTELTFYAGIHTIGGVVLSIVHGPAEGLLKLGGGYLAGGGQVLRA